jgi:hypothetical protein
VEEEGRRRATFLSFCSLSRFGLFFFFVRRIAEFSPTFLVGVGVVVCEEGFKKELQERKQVQVQQNCSEKD